MRYIALGLVFLLGACTAPISTEAARAKILEIQSYTRLACSFVPTIGTIASLLSSGATGPAFMIAQEICTAVTTAPLADGPGRRGPMLRGVVIKGSFVK